VGIYSHIGQNYEPVDKDTLLYYKEAKNGQILEEGITEAGAMSSFIAAGSAYATHGINTVPFFIFYSMFGFQRIGDLIWAAGDMRCRGFPVGATAGRTTLAGEGLQHQDGQSHLIASAHPRVVAYDPAYAYEVAVLVRHGITRMYGDQDDIIFYLTVYNESYAMPPMPPGVETGIIKGMYPVRTPGGKAGRAVHLLGSGPLLNEALAAADRLGEEFGIEAHVWSVTSWTELLREAEQASRWNRLHPTEAPRRSHLETCLDSSADVVVAVSDYSKTLPDALARWMPGRFVALGTDGLGRSESREALRDFFEVDARHITIAALDGLCQAGAFARSDLAKTIARLGIDPARPDPSRI
ncbi:MAG: pyruvate dehydrogenase (acetyl-transferring), homodimeric type, partial [Acidobacteriota bacterium]